MRVDYQFTFHPPSTPFAPPREVVVSGSLTHEGFIIHGISPLVHADIKLDCKMDDPSVPVQQVRYDGAVKVSRDDGSQENWVVHLAAGASPVYPERFLIKCKLLYTQNDAISAIFDRKGHFDPDAAAAAGHGEAWEQVMPVPELSLPEVQPRELDRARETSGVLMGLLTEVIGNLGGRANDARVGISWLRMQGFLLFL